MGPNAGVLVSLLRNKAGGQRVAPVTIQRSVRTRAHMSTPRIAMNAVKASHSQVTALLDATGAAALEEPVAHAGGRRG